MKSLVLVRGGGDIASGIIYRLRRAGFPVVVNEIAIPTMIRREVSYGNAVHNGEMVLHRITSRHVSLSETKSTVKEGIVAVVTESYREVLEKLKPTIVVDAILAKKNLGTNYVDAELVVAVGPGFTAGVDADVVIETMRGHDLGRCIYDGSALPNTGIPGMIGGFAEERVMYSPCAGLFQARRHIGETVQKGEIIGHVNEEPVYAKISGHLRGILKSGLMVSEHFKLADIDARCEESHCFTISDKALAIGGGVMEAIYAWKVEKKANKDK